MAQTIGHSVVRFALMALNFVVLVLGIFVLYSGFKLVDEEHSGVIVISEIDVKNLSIIMFTVGFFQIVVASFGLFGACLESPCMLNTYGFLLFVVICLEIGAVVWAMRTKTNLVDKIHEGVTKAIHQMKNNSDTSRILQELQMKGQCCGWLGPSDYNINSNNVTTNQTYPVLSSCCGSWTETEDSKKTCSSKDVKFTNGCSSHLYLDQIKDTLGNPSSMGIVLILVEIILILGACCLARDE